MIFNPKYPNLLQFQSLSRFDSLFHFSTTIEGGASRDNYDSFNLSLYSGDDVENIAENRNRLIAMLDIEEDYLMTPYQTHEDKILVIDNSFFNKSDLEQTQMLHGIDSVITNQYGVCIAVTTADCVPILIFDPKKKILAAVHAGWRGTLVKLPEKTIFEMQRQFGCESRDLVVGIGPFISQKYFEVGEEIIESFSEAGFAMDTIRYSNNETGKSHLDLGLANKHLLLEVGIPDENIEINDYCTYRDSHLFFSARRQGIKSGRMLTGGFIK